MISEKTPEQDLIKEVGIKWASDVLGSTELIILRTACGWIGGKLSRNEPTQGGSGRRGGPCIAEVIATACLSETILEWKSQKTSPD